MVIARTILTNIIWIFKMIMSNKTILERNVVIHEGSPLLVRINYKIIKTCTYNYYTYKLANLLSNFVKILQKWNSFFDIVRTIKVERHFCCNPLYQDIIVYHFVLKLT